MEPHACTASLVEWDDFGAGVPPMRCAHAKRRVMQGARDAQRTVPDAWWKKHRTADSRGPGAAPGRANNPWEPNY
jgi:hypothetical protein